MKKIVLLCIFSASLVFADTDSVSIDLNNDTAQFKGEFYLNDNYDLSGESAYYSSIAYITSELENDKDRRHMLAFGLKMFSPYADEYGFSFGLGIKAVATRLEKQDFLAIPFALSGKFEVNEKVFFDAEISYATSVFSFADSTGYNDQSISLNYVLLENGFLYVGLRNIELKFEDNVYRNDKSVDFSDPLFFGFKAQF